MKKEILALVMFLALGHANISLASSLETVENTPVANDFVLGPGKTDLSLKPGDKTTQQIMVTNRLGRDSNFKIEVEDFSGSYNTDQTVVLFGEAKGPYSMKDYIKPEVYNFNLKHGERITIPIEITIPKDSQPGGLYASVLVSVVPSTEEAQANQGQTKVISRLGTLFFVRVEGDVNESGRLQSFKVSDIVAPKIKIKNSLGEEAEKLAQSATDKFYSIFKNGFYEKGPIAFEIVFRNDGNVHLIPSGKIEIKNLLGKKVGEVNVDKYFVMPNSLRERVVGWDDKFLLGRYTAVLTLDKNYQQKPNGPETMGVSFWVIPWKILLAGIVGLVVMVFLIKFILKKFKFEIKRK